MTPPLQHSLGPSSTRASAGAIGVMVMCLALGVFWSQSAGGDTTGNVGSSSQSLEVAVAIENGVDHISPAELIATIQADPTALLLVDVRPSSEFAAFHLPGAISLDLPALLGQEGEDWLLARGERTVVLYSNGMVHPAQAWVELARRGHHQVRVLEGGLSQLRAEVLTPPSLRPGYDQAMAHDQAAMHQWGLAWARGAGPSTEPATE